jgi:hypothetical protein
MDLNLGLLREMHPRLEFTTAREYAYRAAVGLERHNHTQGVALAVHLDSRRRAATLSWPDRAGDGATLLDFHRVTEDAAEAIALVLLHAARGCTLVRRIQRGGGADLLLRDADGKEVALEVSGVDKEDTGQQRLKEKAAQLARCRLPGVTKVPCVVELRPPRTRVRTV